MNTNDDVTDTESDIYCPDSWAPAVAESQPGKRRSRRPRRLYEWLQDLAMTVDPQAEAEEHRNSHAHAIRCYHRALAWDARTALRERVQQGWWIGQPPYGYRRHACRIRDRRDPDRRRTVRRHYLIVDDDRADVVAEIFGWYVDDHLGPAAIATRVVAEPDHYPAPLDAATGDERPWTAATVRTILDHPAYLGYTVHGRTRDGRPAPAGQWTWSPGPTHPALVSLSVWWIAHHRLHPVKPNGVTVQIADIEEAA